MKQSFNFYELHDEMVLCVAFSPAGDEVVASGHSGHVKIYNLTQRTVRLKLPAHKEPVNVCRFSPSGKLVCSGSDDASVRLYSAESGDFRGSINLHNLRVLDIRPVPSTNKVREYMFKMQCVSPHSHANLIFGTKVRFALVA